MLTYHQQGTVTFIAGQFHKRCLSHQWPKLAEKLLIWTFLWNLPGTSELIEIARLQTEWWSYTWCLRPCSGVFFFLACCKFSSYHSIHVIPYPCCIFYSLIKLNVIIFNKFVALYRSFLGLAASVNHTIPSKFNQVLLLRRRENIITVIRIPMSRIHSCRDIHHVLFYICQMNHGFGSTNQVYIQSDV